MDRLLVAVIIFTPWTTSVRSGNLLIAAETFRQHIAMIRMAELCSFRAAFLQTFNMLDITCTRRAGSILLFIELITAAWEDGLAGIPRKKLAGIIHLAEPIFIISWKMTRLIG